MVGGGRLVWVPIVLPSSSAWYSGDREHRCCENRASSSGIRALPVLESSSSRRGLGEIISYGQMPSSEGVSVSGEEVEWSGLSSGNRSSSKDVFIRKTPDSCGETDIGNAPRSCGSSV